MRNKNFSYHIHGFVKKTCFFFPKKWSMSEHFLNAICFVSSFKIYIKLKILINLYFLWRWV